MVHFSDPLWYFNPKQLFHNISITTITNAYFQGNLHRYNFSAKEKLIKYTSLCSTQKIQVFVAGRCNFFILITCVFCLRAPITQLNNQSTLPPTTIKSSKLCSRLKPCGNMNNKNCGIRSEQLTRFAQTMQWSQRLLSILDW
jgi:hypothetical protein